MPQVDGFTCCKKIKSMAPQVPVIIFSSLINEQIERKCKEVGADVSLNKEDFTKLIETISKFAVSEKSSAA
jgi:two-component system chemotaxis response regulator CheV